MGEELDGSGVGCGHSVVIADLKIQGGGYREIYSKIWNKISVVFCGFSCCKNGAFLLEVHI